MRRTVTTTSGDGVEGGLAITAARDEIGGEGAGVDVLVEETTSLEGIMGGVAVAMAVVVAVMGGWGRARGGGQSQRC